METLSVRAAVALRLRQLRMQQQRSQAEVAATAGMTQAALSNYECGKRDIALVTAVSLARALGVGVAELLRPVDLQDPEDARTLARYPQHASGPSRLGGGRYGSDRGRSMQGMEAVRN